MGKLLKSNLTTNLKDRFFAVRSIFMSVQRGRNALFITHDWYAYLGHIRQYNDVGCLVEFLNSYKSNKNVFSVKYQFF